MNRKRARTCWLATTHPGTRSAVRAILSSQDVTPLDFKPEQLFAGATPPSPLPDADSILLLDLARECIGHRGVPAALRFARAHTWQSRVLAFAGFARLPFANEVDLAQALTGNPLLPRPESAPAAFAGAVAGPVGLDKVDSGRLERHLRVVGNGNSVDGDTRIRQKTGIGAGELAGELAAAGLVGDRRYRLKKYPECLVGSDAVAWLCRRFALQGEDAVALGEALVQAGYLHHVVKQQPFADAGFFYRVAAPGRFDAVSLDDTFTLLRDTRGLIADRAWRGTNFPQCMVGSEAIDLIAEHFRLGRAEATLLGQSLLDLGMLRHVADEHPFADDFLFYELVTGLPPR